MKKTSIIKNTRVQDIKKYDDLFDEISSNWQLKAERMQKRRWRELRKREEY